jgi:hypothetical protein
MGRGAAESMVEGPQPQLRRQDTGDPSRPGPRSEYITSAVIMTPDEVSRYISTTPLFPHQRYLGTPPPDADPAMAAAYKGALRRMSDQDRQALYQAGGLPAVRAMAVRVAERWLGRDKPVPVIETTLWWQRLLRRVTGIPNA